MAVHDRTYMRATPGGLHAGPRSVTFWVLIAHVAGTFVAAASEGWFRTPLEGHLAYGLDALRAGRVWTLVTHALVGHVSFGTFFALLAFWFFGRLVEDGLGAARFAWFLALATLTGAAVHAGAMLANVGEAVASDVVLGLHGPTTACVALAALREPHRPISLWLLSIPLWLFAAVWVGLDVAAAARLAAVGSGNVWMNLGAAAFGATAWRFEWFPGGGWYAALRRRAPRRAAPAAGPRPDDERARVDALLDKISREGIGSLTAAERDFLTRASRRY